MRINMRITTVFAFCISCLVQVESISTIGTLLDKASSGLGAAGDVLGLVDFVVASIPRPSDTTGTTVRIGVSGQNDTREDQEGKVRVIWAFDTHNYVLGSSSTNLGKIDAGSFGDVVVHQHMGPNIQGQYIDIIASDDEICISWILTIQPNASSEPWVWLGDVGASCGQAWEYSSVTHSGPEKLPYWGKCVWMDTDGGKDIDKDPQAITLRQLKINTFGYGADAKDKGLDYFCSATIFTHDDTGPIEARPAGTHARSSLGTSGGMPIAPRRSSPPPRSGTLRPRAEKKPLKKPRARNQKSAERLLVNSRPEQSAKKLCESPTSRGSDFASVDEGLFCDMDTKTLYPLCSATQRTECFDLAADEMLLRKRDARGLYARDAAPKRYKQIHYVD